MGGTLSTEVVSIGLEGVGIVEIDKKTFPLLLPEHYDATFCAYVLFLPDRGDYTMVAYDAEGRELGRRKVNGDPASYQAQSGATGSTSEGGAYQSGVISLTPRVEVRARTSVPSAFIT